MTTIYLFFLSSFVVILTYRSPSVRSWDTSSSSYGVFLQWSLAGDQTTYSIFPVYQTSDTWSFHCCAILHSWHIFTLRTYTPLQLQLRCAIPQQLITVHSKQTLSACIPAEILLLRPYVRKGSSYLSVWFQAPVYAYLILAGWLWQM